MDSFVKGSLIEVTTIKGVKYIKEADYSLLMGYCSELAQRIVKQKVNQFNDLSEQDNSCQHFGWICPCCSRGNSPALKFCNCSKNCKAKKG